MQDKDLVDTRRVAILQRLQQQLVHTVVQVTPARAGQVAGCGMEKRDEFRCVAKGSVFIQCVVLI